MKIKNPLQLFKQSRVTADIPSGDILIYADETTGKPVWQDSAGVHSLDGIPLGTATKDGNIFSVALNQELRPALGQFTMVVFFNNFTITGNCQLKVNNESSHPLKFSVPGGDGGPTYLNGMYLISRVSEEWIILNYKTPSSVPLGEAVNVTGSDFTVALNTPTKIMNGQIIVVGFTEDFDVDSPRINVNGLGYQSIYRTMSNDAYSAIPIQRLNGYYLMINRGAWYIIGNNRPHWDDIENRPTNLVTSPVQWGDISGAPTGLEQYGAWTSLTVANDDWANLNYREVKDLSGTIIGFDIGGKTSMHISPAVRSLSLSNAIISAMTTDSSYNFIITVSTEADDLNYHGGISPASPFYYAAISIHKKTESTINLSLSSVNLSTGGSLSDSQNNVFDFSSVRVRFNPLAIHPPAAPSPPSPD